MRVSISRTKIYCVDREDETLKIQLFVNVKYERTPPWLHTTNIEQKVERGGKRTKREKERDRSLSSNRLIEAVVVIIIVIGGGGSHHASNELSRLINIFRINIALRRKKTTSQSLSGAAAITRRNPAIRSRSPVIPCPNITQNVCVGGPSHEAIPCQPAV